MITDFQEKTYTTIREFLEKEKNVIEIWIKGDYSWQQSRIFSAKDSKLKLVVSGVLR